MIRLGAPMTMPMPAARAASAAAIVVGNSAIGAAAGQRLGDMLGRGVVVAGPDGGMPLEQAQHVGALPLGMLALLPHPARDQGLELLLAADVAAEAEGAEPVDVVPLPLAGRVVHERDEAQGRLGHQRLEQPEHVRVDDLQAQMQEMVGLERPGRLGPVQHLDRQAEILQPLALAAVEADADRVADGGDPGGGDLRIVGQHGGVGGPAHARARREQALEIVGVQLDQARHEPVAAEIDRTGRHGCACRRPRRSGRRGRPACHRPPLPRSRSGRW